jgi:hypothetical protein
MDRLASHGSDHEEERERKRQTPETRGHRTDSGQTHEPRTEGERAAANDDSWEGEPMIV